MRTTSRAKSSRTGQLCKHTHRQSSAHKGITPVADMPSCAREHPAMLLTILWRFSPQEAVAAS